MDAPIPPKPKKDTPQGLAEVERALSVLQGRHPEHERVAREDRENRSQRQAAIDEVSAVEARRVRRHGLVVIGAIGAGLLVTLVAAIVFRLELSRRGRLEQAADPFRAMGFGIVESSGRGDATASASVEAGCVLAATTGPARIRLSLEGATVEGASPVMSCTCDGGLVTATATGVEGIVLLRADASTFGGSRAAAFLPFKPGAVGQTDQPCSDASLDAWLDARRYNGAAGVSGVVEPVDGAAWRSKLPELVASGFDLAALLKRELPLVVVDVPANSCLLVMPAGARDRVSLRTNGNVVVPAGGSNAAYCTSAGGLFVVERDGGSEPAEAIVSVAIAPAARVGGVAGVRDSAGHANLSLRVAAVAPADHGWDAKQLLVASAVPDSLVSIANAPELPNDPEARIVALSLESPLSLSSDSADGVFSYCDPPLEKATEAVCAFSGAQRWHGANGGIARAKLPFWLFGLQNVIEPAALKVQTQLVGLARRLRREGFEPTTMDAVTETEKGAEVLGRADEDAMVVLGLAPVAPWVFPYSESELWTLEGAPHVIPIAALQRVAVSAKGKLPPKGMRRTVVFRRQKRGLVNR